MALGLAVGGCTTTSSAPANVPVAATHGPSTGEDGLRAAAVTLAALEIALRDGDADAAGRLGADPRAQARLRSLALNARALGITPTLALEQTGDSSTTEVLTADLRWRYARDPGTQQARTSVSIWLDGSGTRIQRFGGPADRRPVWLSGPLTLRQQSSVLVVVEGEGARAERRADRLLHLARDAQAAVRRVLPDSRLRLVVERPRSGRSLERALGVEAGHDRSIAAVTATVDGSDSPGSPVHVFVNPDVFDRMTPVGARVVLTHEVTHVATGAATSQMPLWLLEGFADYVALRDVDLAPSQAAAQLIEAVRAEGIPRSLPAAEDFDAGSTSLGAVYESAWLACELVVEAAGERALVAVYRDVAAGGQVGAALADHADLTLAELTRRWRERLRALADD